MNCTLPQVWSEAEVDEELNGLVYELGRIASVGVRTNMACISLICNVKRTSEILQQVGRGSCAGMCSGVVCASVWCVQSCGVCRVRVCAVVWCVHAAVGELWLRVQWRLWVRGSRRCMHGGNPYTAHSTHSLH